MSSDPSGRCWKEQLFSLSNAHIDSHRNTEAHTKSYFPIVTLQATQHIRRMHGGTQSHLMGCSDGNYYVVKFPNNPQGTRTLVNELLCASLCHLLNLPIPRSTVVSVGDDLIERTRELCVETARGSLRCQAGLCYGSRYPDPNVLILDSWPKRRIHDVANLADFAGMMVFDIWTSNIDFRQVRFLKESPTNPWKAIMFDNSLAFRGAEWTFCDKPRLAVYPCFYVYEFVCGVSSFDPWLAQVENIHEDDLLETISGIPSQWYWGDAGSLSLLLEQLWTRRTRVRELLLSLRAQSPTVFPNWRFESALATEG